MRALKLAAVLLTALAFVPTGAHFFELPNKIALSERQYFAVQQVYRGWALFGVVLIGVIVVNLVLGTVLHRRGARSWTAFAAALLIAASLGVFFARVYPTSQETANWTSMPADWRRLRSQWEYGHAADAVLTFAALGLCAWAATGSK
jgi:hypothetical protein